MYGGVSITDENALPLLSAAVQFQMQPMEALCAEHIFIPDYPGNICALMDEAIELRSTVLQKKYCEMFSLQTSAIAPTTAFVRMSKMSLSAFLDVEEINILEVNLFHCVRGWMAHQCKIEGLDVTGENMRKMIGNDIFKIRFPTMTHQDFANSVTADKGLLTNEEIGQVSLKITVFDSDNIDCPFPTKFRCHRSTTYVSFRDMINLSNRFMLYDKENGEEYNLETMLRNIRDKTAGKTISPETTPIRILLQCCADLANSSGMTFHASEDNQHIRNEIYEDFLKWKEEAESQNVNYTMTSFLQLRKKLDNIIRWKYDWS